VVLRIDEDVFERDAVLRHVGIHRPLLARLDRDGLLGDEVPFVVGAVLAQDKVAVGIVIVLADNGVEVDHGGTAPGLARIE
jgi:hypothetical protein